MLAVSSNVQTPVTASGRKRQVRLRRSNTSGAGFSRHRSGRGFSYRDVGGRTVTDPELRARFGALAIPPAWTEVWIAPYPNGHIQATGTDAAGRRQYLYHPDWHTRQDRVKFARALELAQALPAARGYVTRSLRRSPSSAEQSRDRALAAAFRILDQGALRIGSERYAEENGSHGLSTLLRSHAQVSDDTVVFEFPAKSSQAWSSTLVDADVAEYLRDQDRLLAAVDPDYTSDPDRLMLTWIDDDTVRSVSAADVNGFIKERTGSEFTAKDFRTLRGTAAAAVSLARSGASSGTRARSRALTVAMQAAAEVLGNTPAIARSSYVDPRVVDAYNTGRTIDPTRPASAESELRRLLLD